MQAWTISAFARPARLELTHLPAEELRPCEVRLGVRAVSLNYRDLLVAAGTYAPGQPLPLVPCSDASCEVLEVGPGVTRWRPGDRVLPAFSQTWLDGPCDRDAHRGTLGSPLHGVLRGGLILHEQGLVATPAHLGHVEASCLPCAGVTAWQALVGHGAVRAGQAVLVLGTGGVASFAIQLARAAGARVLVVTTRPERVPAAYALGAHEVLCSAETPLWGGVVSRRLAGGADHVVEVGGMGTLDQSLRAVRPGGTIHLIGVLAPTPERPVDLLPAIMRNVAVQGVFVGSRRHLQELANAMEITGLRPHVDRVFPFDQAEEAFQHLHRAGHVGKVVVELPQ